MRCRWDASRTSSVIIGMKKIYIYISKHTTCVTKYIQSLLLTFQGRKKPSSSSSVISPCILSCFTEGQYRNSDFLWANIFDRKESFDKTGLHMMRKRRVERIFTLCYIATQGHTHTHTGALWHFNACSKQTLT